MNSSVEFTVYNILCGKMKLLKARIKEFSITEI